MPARAYLLIILTAVALGLPAAGHAQTRMSCDSIAGDVTTSATSPFGPPGDSDQTAAQTLNEWTTAQDPDADACRDVREVQRRLAVETTFARRKCPQLVGDIQTQAGVAQSETKILCGKAETVE